jgi:hypothetical protein
MYSRFNETLHLLAGRPIDPDDTLSVCAMGPVAEDDQIDWMRVWVWQQDGPKRAWSSGLSGQHLGGHDESPKERLPFEPDSTWMIQTKLEPGSAQFTVGKPATAMALALVTHPDNTSDVQQWSQGVLIEGIPDHHHHHDEGEQEPGPGPGPVEH